MDVTENMLPISRAGELKVQQPEENWLIRFIWARSAVGIIGGAPKCGKSWFRLDMAVSVASGTPCLGGFPVETSGPALVYLAEDAIPAVQARIESLCLHREIDIKRLNLYVITASTLRLDLDCDQQRLQATLANLQPKLLVLDPLVRLHRLDENSASDISNLLGFIREVQRTHDTAVALVHHASKKHRAQPGQALRGSSDLHAFGDSNAYLARRNERIVLTLEHRSNKPPDPIELELKSLPDGSQPHLEPLTPIQEEKSATLADRVLTVLKHAEKPLTRTIIRKNLKINNQRLGQTLSDLDRQGFILRVAKGWTYVHQQKKNRNPENHES